MYSCFIVFIISVCCTPFMTWGCTTVTNPDGTTSKVLGFESPEAQAQARETVKAASDALPYPFNLIVKSVGDLAILGIGVYAAKKKGEDLGWDLAHKESPLLKEEVPPPVPPTVT